MKNINRKSTLKIISFVFVFTILIVSLVIKNVNASGDVGGCCATGHTDTGDECGCGDPGGDDPPPCSPSCGGSCTFPACPSGYATTNPNNYCSGDTRDNPCTHGDGCGGTCTKNQTCYKTETNTALSAPSSLTMTLDGIVYGLSTNPSSPTRIKVPASNSNNVTVGINPTISADIGVNRGVGYLLRANNYGVNNEWSAWNDCSNPRPEDFCKELSVATSAGGIITTSGGYTIHTYTSSGTFTIRENLNVEVLVVGGGGGGGYDAGGGGGGGGVVYQNQLYLSSGSYSVVVGSRGSGSTYVGGRGSNGGNSSFANIVAIGGGGGGSKNNSGLQGGSGGGGGHLNNSGAAGISGQGNSGGTASNTRGGGGGGASGIGSSGTSSGNGGGGYLSTISGTSKYYGGGGGGGNYAGAGGTGGNGGGGNGGNNSGYSGSAGVANTGGGGGANGNINISGGTGNMGGSGIVIIKYLTPPEATGTLFDFTPSSLSLTQVLKNGATGNIGALYYSINRCDDNRLYSPVLQTYYRVNSNPVMTQTPSITKTANNTTTISLVGQDPDGDALKGVIAWFSSTGTTNTRKVTSITSSYYTGTNNGDIGIMILSDKKIYLLNRDLSTWSYVGTNSAVIKDANGQQMFLIGSISVSSTGSSAAYTFVLTPIWSLGANFCNNYTFYSTFLDQYMIVNSGSSGNYSIVNGTKIDHSYMGSYQAYRLETNDDPKLPSATGTLIIDGISYANVSKNSSSPTSVKIPSNGTSDINYNMTSILAPIGSGGVNLYFTPSPLTAGAFPEGQTKSIVETYQTLNRCDSNRKSISRTVYYKVNNAPIITNPTCPMNPDEQCTIDALLDDIGEKEIKGCTTTTYTGSNANNPLKISIESKDADGNGQIKGAIVWLSKGGFSNTITNISPRYTYTNINEIGIMIIENGGNHQVYATNYDNTWALVPNNILKTNDGKMLATVSGIKIETVGQDKVYSFSLTFIKNISSNPSGQYSFMAQVVDQHMINSNLWVDQSTLKRYFNWNIDLDDPVIDSFEHTIKSMQIMNLSWTLSDQISPISNYVINAYRSESPAINTEISITGKTNKITPTTSTPLEEEIGNIGKPNQWEYLNINTNPHSSNADIDIGINEGGSINLYMTAFDKACNYTNNYNSVNLEPWLATKGGIVYSKGNILTNTKDLTSVSNSYYIIGDSSTIRNANKNELDIGTEAISSRDAFIKSLLHTQISNVRATNISDTNDRNNYFFDYFKKNLEVQMSTLTPITDINGCSDEKNKCVLYTTEDIEIPSGYVCNKSILFMTEGNIIINPNLTTERSGLNGCIFIAKNNIEIREGGYISNNVVGYDYMEGFYFAQNQILIPLVDTSKVLRDGVEVKGSLVSMGDNIQNETAIKLLRDLRLYNDINPALIVVYDNIYTKIAEIFFGQEAAIYKQEVGYKSY